ncbi:PGPGW domain-containing protein [Nocardioides sp. BP30]|uniref:PGPGW domain-containing protein n=1 Tax=Nocardioides sp. BP30 TaxID=3036374 RepID=UPI002468AA4C|nr:PGPGW domain-containing protein [Nocardioides sp. BP30]WGL52391.1 PGPGW domain-containing protein [Nocardioides sp. BP30]
MSAIRRLLLEVLGWLFVVLGIAALVLPGPGLLLLFVGLALLSRQYEWARRRLDPVRLRAMRSAADGVATWPRLMTSALAALALAACGVLWIVDPAVPGWWPLPRRLWLVGTWQTGATLLFSAAVALTLLVLSYRRFHGKPEARAELEREMTAADRADEV